MVGAGVTTGLVVVVPSVGAGVAGVVVVLPGVGAGVASGMAVVPDAVGGGVLPGAFVVGGSVGGVAVGDPGLAAGPDAVGGGVLPGVGSVGAALVDPGATVAAGTDVVGGIVVGIELGAPGVTVGAGVGGNVVGDELGAPGVTVGRPVTDPCADLPEPALLPSPSVLLADPLLFLEPLLLILPDALSSSSLNSFLDCFVVFSPLLLISFLPRPFLLDAFSVLDNNLPPKWRTTRVFGVPILPWVALKEASNTKMGSKRKSFMIKLWYFVVIGRSIFLLLYGRLNGMRKGEAEEVAAVVDGS